MSLFVQRYDFFAKLREGFSDVRKNGFWGCAVASTSSATAEGKICAVALFSCHKITFYSLGKCMKFTPKSDFVHQPPYFVQYPPRRFGGVFFYRIFASKKNTKS